MVAEGLTDTVLPVRTTSPVGARMMGILNYTVDAVYLDAAQARCLHGCAGCACGTREGARVAGLGAAAAAGTAGRVLVGGPRQPKGLLWWTRGGPAGPCRRCVAALQAFTGTAPLLLWGEADAPASPDNILGGC